MNRHNMTRAIMLTAAFAVVLMGSSAVLAADWNGLTVDAQYTLNIADFGYGSGTIKQYSGTTNIAASGNILYCLPRIGVAQATVSPFWGVCIDTHEYSANPQGAVLKKGWADAHAPLGTPGRLNGTVLDQNAWNHTTYLFSQFGSSMGTMTNVQRAAFQLATWEVLSGDGSELGGSWINGGGNFTATNVSGALLTEANNYVKAAYVGFSDKWSAELANQSFYFSGVKVNSMYQDYLVYAPAPSNNNVPEIPAVVLGPLGLFALGALRRRFAR